VKFRQTFSGPAAVIVMLACAVSANAAPSRPAQPPRDLASRLSTPPSSDSSDNPGLGTSDRNTCTASGDPVTQLDINCDSQRAPDSEFAIVADPADPAHLLAGSNDTFVRDTPGSTIFTNYIGTFTSFDGGSTWTDSQLPNGNSVRISDPAPAFDGKFQTAHMGYVGFSGGKSGPLPARVDVEVATSHDGGKSWDPAVTVATGTGTLTGIQHDKPWVIADNNPTSPFYGRLYVVWTRFVLSHGAYDESPIFLSYSDNGGTTWSDPHEISGASERFCFAQVDQADVNAGKDGQDDCDQDQNARPAIAPDGTLYVSFTNFAQDQLSGDFDDQVMIVRSTDGGLTFNDPVHIVRLQDGFSDYPLNHVGRQTLTGHQFRVTPFFAGNIAVDASASPNRGRVYLAYMDNEGVPGPTPVTDTNIFLAYSDDLGQTWTGGDAGTTNPSSRIRVDDGPGSDQFFAALAVDPTDGQISALYLDGRPDRTFYDTTLATAPTGLGTFSYQLLNNVPSNPNHARSNRAGVPECVNCTDFIGDYIGLDVDVHGRAHAVWDQLSRPAPDGSGLFADDAYYARR
jgi:hypothetical protein